MEIGIILPSCRIRENFQWCADNGFTNCQLYIPDDFTDDFLEETEAARAETGVAITALIATGSGPHVYDFYSGPLTLGIIPAHTVTCAWKK